jgi:hypothetical protein
MDIDKLLLAIVAVLGAIGTIVQGVMKALGDRSTRDDTNKRADRADAVAYLTRELDYYRKKFEDVETRYDELRIKYDAIQQMSRERADDLDHAVDVAQAALLELRAREKGERPRESG